MIKTCPHCLEAQDESAFPFRDKAKGTRRPKCYKCVRAWYKTYYEANKDRLRPMIVASNKNRIAKRRTLLKGLKSSPCADCGVSYPPYVMDFDHLSNKEFLLSRGGLMASKARLEQELDKCELVCSNCHRERTYQRLLKARPVGAGESAG